MSLTLSTPCSKGLFPPRGPDPRSCLDGAGVCSAQHARAPVSAPRDGRPRGWPHGTASWAPVPAGSARAPRLAQIGPRDAREPRRGRGPRTAQALPALRARPHARAHLLGLPRATHHDRRGHRRARPARLRAPAHRRHTRSRARAGRLRGGRDRRARDRGGDPALPATGAIRREPRRRGLPHPRPHPLDHRDALRRSRRSDRGRVRPRDVVEPRLHGRLAPRRLAPERLVAADHVDVPVAAPRADPRVPRVPRLLQAPAHRDELHQRVLREHAAAGTADPVADRPRGARERRRAPRGSDDRGPHVETVTRPVRVHRVRAVPGCVPRLEHREAALRSC